jgi:hypothetical protein
MHSFNGRDLSIEQEELCACMARVEDECTAEVLMFHMQLRKHTELSM